MISLAMQLGLAPIPVPVTRGRVHRSEGSEPERKQNDIGVLSRAHKTAARRAEILAMIERDGPATRDEISKGLSTGAAKDTIRVDVAELIALGKLRMEMHGQAHVYYLAGDSA